MTMPKEKNLGCSMDRFVKLIEAFFKTQVTAIKGSGFEGCKASILVKDNLVLLVSEDNKIYRWSGDHSDKWMRADPFLSQAYQRKVKYDDLLTKGGKNAKQNT